MFQSNQAYVQFLGVTGGEASFFAGRGWSFGLILAVLVGAVTLGGIRSIARVAGRLVPFMALLYSSAAVFVIAANFSRIPEAIRLIVTGAFAPEGVAGGAVAVMILGFRRAAFSNEAGIGSAAIAHSAVRTDEPITQGLVALLEPFIDTVVVCAMTGLVLVVSGAYAHPDAGESIAMTAFAFATVFPWYPVVLSVTAVLFAFSTMIAWSYYGEKCWEYLFGAGSVLIYKVIFLFFCWAGAVFNAASVLDFGDLMILGMAFPNVLGVVLLAGPLKKDLDVYLARLRAGDFPRRD